MAAVSRYTLVLFAVVFAVALLSHPSSGRSITAVSPRRSAAAVDASPSDLLVNGFAQGVVELAISIGSDTFREIDTLVSHTKDDELKADLNSCQTLYGISTEALRKAVFNLKNKSYDADHVIKGLVGGADAGVKCEELFKLRSNPVEKSPLTVRNGIFEQLRSAALSSFDLLAV